MKSRSFLTPLIVLALSAVALAQSRPNTIWYPASPANYTRVNGSRSINYVVIHTTEGNGMGAMPWFANPASHVSAHYVVQWDGRIYQCLRDQDIGWHAANNFYNDHSIGIEHAGYAFRNTWTEIEYRRSAQLTRWICARYGVPIDRRHLVGHSEVPGATHRDPGPFFNWSYYLALVRGATLAPASLQAQEVTGEAPNVRSGPGGSFSIVGTARRGQMYVSHERQGSWLKVYFDDRSGWVLDGAVVRRRGGIGRRIVGGEHRVRSGPDWGTTVIGSCRTGQVFIANAQQGPWLRIWYAGRQGWIREGDTTRLYFP